MPVDLKDERQRKFVANMLATRAMIPIWAQLDDDDFSAVHAAMDEALEEVSRMTLDTDQMGFFIVHRDLGTPEQEARDAAKVEQIRQALEQVPDA